MTYCELCGRRVCAVRRRKSKGRKKAVGSRVKRFADKRHSLCSRCHDSQFQKIRQEQKFAASSESRPRLNAAAD